MRRRMVALVMSGVITLSLCGCNVAETAEAVENALSAVEDIKKTLNDDKASETNDGKNSAESSADEGKDGIAVSGNSEDLSEEENADIESVLAVLLADDTPYPTTIDLEEIYGDEDAFMEDYDRVVELLSEFAEKYRDNLNDKDSIYACLSEYFDGEMNYLFNKMQYFAELASKLDVTNPFYSNALAKCSELNEQFIQNTSFVDVKLNSLSDDEKQDILGDALFDKYRYDIERSFYSDKIQYDEETQKIIALLESSYGNGLSDYQVLTAAEIPPFSVVYPDGREVLMPAFNVNTLYDAGFERDEVYEIENDYYGNRAVNAETIANMLQNTIKENYNVARIKGYESTLEYKLGKADLEPAVYRNNIEAVHNLLNDYQRYNNLKGSISGQDTYTISDLRISVSNYQKETDYDEAVKTMESGLSVLGADYIELLDKLARSGCIDVYPAEKKSPNSFAEVFVEKDGMPSVVLNYRGTTASTSELAHECGHAMYSYFSARNNNLSYMDSQATIFTQEIASLSNELLMLNYHIENAQTDEEKLYYLGYLIDFINQAMIDQTRNTEFEEYLYNTVEDGSGLSVQDMNEKQIELLKQYYGDKLNVLPQYGYTWTYYPHYFMGYYMYQYSTSLNYAGILVNRILNGDENALKNYRRMLTLGSSMKPIELLELIDIDPTKMDAYSEFGEYYKSLVDEFEEMVK